MAKKTPLAEATQQLADVPAPNTPATHIAVPVHLAEAVANYLGRQPYADVQQLIDGLRQSTPISITDN